MLCFAERQTAFVIRTTAHVHTYHDFLTSDMAVVLFNSTCMCLQSIGETIRQVDNFTKGRLFAHYPDTPWKKVIGMRNIISHEYLSVDPQVIFATVKTRLGPLLDALRQVITELEMDLYTEQDIL